jgi:hypothetical protein
MAVIKKNQLIAPFLGAKLSFIPGQDPMGMLNIGEQIFSMLLPGLNNVTERIRYYSFYCWFFGWYSKHNGSENPKVQRNYLRRAEYLMALISASKEEGGIPGITKANYYYNIDASSFSLFEGTGELEDVTENTYWKNPRGIFGQNYVSSMRQMGLIRDKGDNLGIYIRTAFEKEGIVTGKDLEEAFEANITPGSLEIFLSALEVGNITHQKLIKINKDFDLINVPLRSAENSLLIQMLTEVDQPTHDVVFYFRRNTIALYLNLLKEKETIVSVQDFVNVAYKKQGRLEGNENDTLMGWYYYQLSQYWHIVCTSSLKHLLDTLQDKTDSGWYIEEKLVNELTYDISTMFVNEYAISKNIPFAELRVLEEENSTIVKNIYTQNSIKGLCNALFLLKKLIHENNTTIKEQLEFAQKYNLHSSSDFIAVYNDLKDKSEMHIPEFIKYFLKKYILNRHQIVAINKMNASQSTEKFLREDGYIRFVDYIDFDFSNPRLGNAVTFLKNLSIISSNGEELTAEGIELQKNLAACLID